jgi:transcriptional regulator with XRE-family HTH domain
MPDTPFAALTPRQKARAVMLHLRQVRLARRMDQQALSRALAAAFPDQAVGKSQISAMERGDRRVSVEQLFAIAEVLQVGEDALFRLPELAEVSSWRDARLSRLSSQLLDDVTSDATSGAADDNDEAAT